MTSTSEWLMRWTPVCLLTWTTVFFSALVTEEHLPCRGSQGHSSEVRVSGGRAAMFHLELEKKISQKQHLIFGNWRNKMYI